MEDTSSMGQIYRKLSNTLLSHRSHSPFTETKHWFSRWQLFRAHKWIGEPKIGEPHKCDDLSWFSLDELPKNIVPCIKEALKNIKHANFYSEYEW